MRRRRRSRYHAFPVRVSVRRVAAALAAVLVGIVGIYAFRTVMGISHLTGSSPGEVLGCLTKVKCDSALAGTTQRIMTGDLSERVPVGRSGDELDRLAEHLNAMLERIEALMAG